jgi:WS/DGAT/MGAT family acyltransferase
VAFVPVTDAVFLLAEARERPMHVGGLQLFKPPPDAGLDHVGEVHRAAVRHGEVHPKLRRRPVRLGSVGPWVWEDDPRLDLEYHVRHSALPNPGRVRELLALTSRLHGTLLDRHRPLWEAHLIEGLADGRFAMYTKIHHALVDGVSAMRLLERALSTDADERDMPPPFAPARRPPRRDEGSPGPAGPLASLLGAAGAITDGVRGVVGATDAAVRSIVEGFRDEAAALPYRAPRSPLNVPITGARRFAADGYSLERIRGVAKALDGTINDVVMGMSAGALRRYLIELDGLPDEPLVAMVPVSLHGDDDADDAGNMVGLVLCNLATHLEDPQRRFELVQRSMRTGKLRLEGLNPTAVLLLSALSFAGLGLGPLYRFPPLRKPPFNIIISNVPGPRERLYWNGAELDGMYPVSIPIDGQALNITVSSYVDQMGFGLTGCRTSAPHLQHMLDHLEASLTELEHVAGTA